MSTVEHEIVVQSEARQETTSMVTVIEQFLRIPGGKVEVLDRILDMQIKVMERQAKLDFANAMTAFNALKEVIPHNRKGTTAGNAPFSYADYPQTVKFVTPWCNEVGLSFSHREDAPMYNDKHELTSVMMHCKIMHSGGHFEEFPYPAMVDERLRGKLSPSQLLQLAKTYAKRQSLAMGLGFATGEDEDDDDAQKQAANGDDSTPATERLIEHNKLVKEHFWSISAIKQGIQEYLGDTSKTAPLDMAVEAASELSDDVKRGLWIADSKGGIFTTIENQVMKSDEWGVLNRLRLQENDNG